MQKLKKNVDNKKGILLFFFFTRILKNPLWEGGKGGRAQGPPKKEGRGSPEPLGIGKEIGKRERKEKKK